jgi:hypothetical protein
VWPWRGRAATKTDHVHGDDAMVAREERLKFGKLVE